MNDSIPLTTLDITFFIAVSLLILTIMMSVCIRSYRYNKMVKRARKIKVKDCWDDYRTVLRLHQHPEDADAIIVYSQGFCFYGRHYKPDNIYDYPPEYRGDLHVIHKRYIISVSHTQRLRARLKNK